MRAIIFGLALAGLMVSGCRRTGEREYQVTVPDVDVRTDTRTVRVPDVDVVRDTRTVTVPRVRIDTTP